MRAALRSIAAVVAGFVAASVVMMIFVNYASFEAAARPSRPISP
jgi:hypothetical protein